MPNDHEPALTPLWTSQEIAVRVTLIAEEIDRDYLNTTPVLVGALKGAFIFLADLMRKIQTPVEVEFMRVSSYESGTESSGEVQVDWGPTGDAIGGRHIIVVEDIIDTGITTTAVVEYLKQFAPSSIRICTLLDRPERRIVEIEPDYTGFNFSDYFVVGYGLDLDQKYRQLPGIYGLATNT